MDARAILVKKRDGRRLDAAELSWFAHGLADGRVSDAQAGAFAMAVLLNGLTDAERGALTRAMRDSGRVLRWRLPGPVLDKHSTGGIGDAVSLVLAPALAACGAYVPMISGRGLGHTGGTLDKMEAIPGYAPDIPAERLQAVVAETGCAIVGASDDVAPADRRLYAVRDVTGTVETIDLIVPSILSKKLAAGLAGLVLDVKVGSGAFLPGEDQAQALAGALVSGAVAAGCPACALITDMDQPLATAAGNALEVRAAVEILAGGAGETRLAEVTRALGGALLALHGMAASPEAGAGMIADAISGGQAAERFGRMVAALGGPVDFMAAADRHLPRAPVVRDVVPARPGTVTAIDGRALGMAVIGLGGGRRVESDRIDPAVGLDRLAGIGDAVDSQRPLARVHAADTSTAGAAAAAVRGAYVLGDGPAAPAPAIRGRVG
jgi:thymidine phosphorylase